MVSLLSAKYWAVSETSFERYLPLILDRVKNGKDLNIFKREDSAFEMGGRDPVSTLPVFRNFSKVAYIPVIGGVTKHGDLCSHGMRTIGQMVKAANESENIEAILFEFDSPGGTVDGTAELGSIINSSTKPTVAFCDNMTASAGYWLASQCDYIYANSLNTTEIGSIGSLYIHVNQSKYIENEVGEVTIFRATQSTDKARINSIEPLTDELRAEIVDELTEITEDFKSTVKKGRGTKLNTGDEDIFTGKMYSKKTALKMGMIDAIGTIDQAVEKASTLARTGGHKRIRNSKSNNESQNKVKVMSLKSWLSGSQEANEGGESPSQIKVAVAELETLKSDIQSAQASIELLQGEKTALAGQVATLDQTILEKDKEITDLKAQITELEKKPAQEAAAAFHEGDSTNTEDKGKEKKTDAQASHFSKIAQFRKGK